MSYFALPTICNDDKLKDNIIYDKALPDNIKSNINKTLSTYLTDAKNQIDSKQSDWDKYKKFTNQYEYIHTVVPGTKSAVCKCKPLSRSFFKMILFTLILNKKKITDSMVEDINKRAEQEALAKSMGDSPVHNALAFLEGQDFNIEISS